MDTVIETIAKQIDKLENETGRRRAEVINIRKHFWDDVKVNTDTFDDYLETVINLRQQAQSLAVTQITHKHTFNRLAALRRMQKAPYFGRIDFTEEGEPALRKFILVSLPLLMQAAKTFSYTIGAHLFQASTMTIHQGRQNIVRQAVSLTELWRKITIHYSKWRD